MRATTTTDHQPGAIWASLRVAPDVPLGDLRAAPPGEARRSAVVARMREATAAGAAAALDRLGGALAPTGATAVLAEQLWLDGSATFRVDLPTVAGDDAARGVRELLERSGARILDGEDLPPGGVGPMARPAVGHGFGETRPAAAGAAGAQWFSGVLGFDGAHAAGLTGEGVRLAVVDSGVDPAHPGLAAALGRGRTIDPFPGAPISSGHGTFVAGIVAGATTGLAPGVDLTSSRTYGASFGDHRGEDLPSRYAQRVNGVRALQEALAPADGARGADILVTSWGILDAPGEPAPDYDAAMATIAAAGAVVVAAAGNDGGRGDGAGTLAVPAQLADVLAVGGVDRHAAWHPGASVGPSPRTTRTKPDLAAPVVDIRSTALGGGETDTTGQSGDGFAGTSAAAPIAASLVALLTQAVHDRGSASPDVDEVVRVLPLLTHDVDTPGPDPRTGFGVVDATRLDAAADAIVAARAAR